MPHVISRFIEKHIPTLTYLTTAAVLILYLLSQYIAALHQWIIQGGFFSVIIIVVVLEVLRRVIDTQAPKSPVSVYLHQHGVLEQLRRTIQRRSPQNADLIEYSTSTITPLLEWLRNAHTEIRLLMCHPDAACSDLQRGVIETFLRININVTFQGYPHVTIRLYTVPASIRGRLFDDYVVCTGFYSYNTGDQGEVRMHGHDNPMVLATADCHEGRRMQRGFRKVFDALWNDESTVDAKEYLSRPRPTGGSDGVSKGRRWTDRHRTAASP